MRSKDKKKQAIAVAEIATYRKRGNNGASKRLMERSVRIARKATGQEHPAITPEILAKSGSDVS